MRVHLPTRLHANSPSVVSMAAPLFESTAVGTSQNFENTAFKRRERRFRNVNRQRGGRVRTHEEMHGSASQDAGLDSRNFAIPSSEVELESMRTNFSHLHEMFEQLQQSHARTSAQLAQMRAAMVRERST